MKATEIKTISKQIQEFMRTFEDVSEEILLSYVYLKYSDFAAKFEIKETVFNILKTKLSEFNKIARNLRITDKNTELELKKARKETLQKISSS